MLLRKRLLIINLVHISKHWWLIINSLLPFIFIRLIIIHHQLPSSLPLLLFFAYLLTSYLLLLTNLLESGFDQCFTLTLSLQLSLSNKNILSCIGWTGHARNNSRGVLVGTGFGTEVGAGVWRLGRGDVVEFFRRELVGSYFGEIGLWVKLEKRLFGIFNLLAMLIQPWIDTINKRITLDHVNPLNMHAIVLFIVRTIGLIIHIYILLMMFDEEIFKDVVHELELL